MSTDVGDVVAATDGTASTTEADVVTADGDARAALNSASCCAHSTGCHRLAILSKVETSITCSMSVEIFNN